MRKITMLIFSTIVLCAIAGCGGKPSKSDLEKQSVTIVTDLLKMKDSKQIANEFGEKCKSVTITKDLSENVYSGTATLENDKKISVKITYNPDKKHIYVEVGLDSQAMVLINQSLLENNINVKCTNIALTEKYKDGSYKALAEFSDGSSAFFKIGETLDGKQLFCIPIE